MGLKLYAFANQGNDKTTMSLYDEHTVREHICQVGRWLWEKNYIAGTDGNISARLGDRLLVTPSGLSKGHMRPEQLVWTDLAGRVLPESHNVGLQPSSEIWMHTMAYRQRPDIGAVVHAHTPIAVALSLAGYAIACDVIPEMVYSLGCVPTLAYAAPSSQANADIIEVPIRTHDALVLTHHGSLAVGLDLHTAYLGTEKIEHAALLTAQALQLGPLRPIPAGEAERVWAMRQARYPDRRLCPGGAACPHNTLYAATAARYQAS